MDLFAPSLSISPPIPFATPPDDRVDQVPSVGAEWAALTDTATWDGDLASPLPPPSLERGGGKAGDGTGVTGGVSLCAGARDLGGRRGVRGVPAGPPPTWEAATTHEGVAEAGSSRLAKGENAGEQDVKADLPLTIQGTGVVLPTIPPLMRMSLGPSAGARHRRRAPSQLTGSEGSMAGEVAGEGPLAAAAAAFFARSVEDEAVPADMDVDPPPSLLFPSMPSTPPALASPGGAAAVLPTPPAAVLAKALSAARGCDGERTQLIGGGAAGTTTAAHRTPTAVWPLSGREAGVGGATATAPASQCSSSISSDGHLHLSAVTSEATDSASPSDEESVSSQVLLAQAKKRKLRPPSPAPPTDDRGGMGGAHQGAEGCRYCGVLSTAAATITSLTAELSSARTSSAQLDKRLAFAHEENRALRRRLTSLTADHHAASARVTQLTSALTAAQQQLASAAAAAASYTPPAGWSAPGASGRAGSKRKQASMFSLTFVAVLVVIAAVNRLSPSGRHPSDTRLVLSSGAGAGASVGSAPSVGPAPPGHLALPYASSSMLRKESPPSQEWASTHRALPPSSAEAATSGSAEESVPALSASAIVSSSSSSSAAAVIPASVSQTTEPVVVETPAPVWQAPVDARPASTESGEVDASPSSRGARASKGSVVVASPSAYSYVLCRDALAAIRSVRRCAAARARGDVCDRCGHSDLVASQVPPDVAAATGRAVPLSHSVRAQAVVVGTPAAGVHMRDAAGGSQWQTGVPAGSPRALHASVIGGGSGVDVRPAGVAATPAPRHQADAPSLGPVLHMGVDNVDDGTLSLLLPAAGLGLDGLHGGEEADGALAEVICRVTDVRRFAPPAPGPAAVRAPGVHGSGSSMW